MAHHHHGRNIFIPVLMIIGVGISLFFILRMPIADYSARIFKHDLPVISVGTVPIRVEVAVTDAERERGLSDRDSLGATRGMLFIFEELGYPKIWMKNMRFPIDIIWVNQNFKVVDITSDVTPDTYPTAFEPRVPARMVIEVNSRFAESFGIKVGDVVTIPKSVLPEDLIR